jgi:hypothetical protein
MDKQTRKGLIIFLCVIAAALLLWAGELFYKAQHPFVYAERLDDTILRVDDEAVTLRELGVYIYQVETFVDEQARLYNPEDRTEYWNKHFSAGLESAFVSDMAVEAVYGTCVCDHIYEKMAQEDGFTLSAKKEEKAQEDAEELWNEMSEEQRQATGVTKETVLAVCQRKALVSAYAEKFVQEVDFTGYSGNPEELLSYSGDYYKNEILPQHKIWYNNALKKEIRIGKITIDFGKI